MINQDHTLWKDSNKKSSLGQVWTVCLLKVKKCPCKASDHPFKLITLGSSVSIFLCRYPHSLMWDNKPIHKGRLPDKGGCQKVGNLHFWARDLKQLYFRRLWNNHNEIHRAGMVESYHNRILNSHQRWTHQVVSSLSLVDTSRPTLMLYCRTLNRIRCINISPIKAPPNAPCQEVLPAHPLKGSNHNYSPKLPKNKSCTKSQILEMMRRKRKKTRESMRKLWENLSPNRESKARASLKSKTT